MGSSFCLLMLLYSGIRYLLIEIEPMPEAIDISVEQPKEEGSRK